MRYLLPLLIVLPFCAQSQTTSLPAAKPAPPVCFSAAIGAKINDSLRVLPLVRKEAKHLRAAMMHYRFSADSAKEASLAHASSAFNLQEALNNQKIETTRARLDAKAWKGTARRRGWLNWLGVVALGVGAGLAITH